MACGHMLRSNRDTTYILQSPQTQCRQSACKPGFRTRATPAASLGDAWPETPRIYQHISPGTAPTSPKLSQPRHAPAAHLSRDRWPATSAIGRSRGRGAVLLEQALAPGGPLGPLAPRVDGDAGAGLSAQHCPHALHRLLSPAGSHCQRPESRPEASRHAAPYAWSDRGGGALAAVVFAGEIVAGLLPSAAR